MSKSTANLLFTGGEGKPFQIYDPSTKEFKTLPDSPNPIKGSAITVHKGYVMVVGGEGNMGSIQTYNNEKGTWKVGSVLKSPRTNAKISLNRNKLYVVGGYDESGAAVSSIEMFEVDEGRCKFIKKADVPWLNGDRKNYEVEAKNDKIYFVGGNDSSNDSLGKFNTYDMNTGEEEELNPLLEGRSHCATILWHNQIVALGGVAHADGTGVLASVETYSFKKFVWLNLPPLLAAKATHSACLHDRKIWVIGGDDVIEAFDTDDAEWSAV